MSLAGWAVAGYASRRLGRHFAVGPFGLVADTEVVSVDGLVQYVGEVLGRAHLLFGDPADGAGVAAAGAGGQLSSASGVVRGGQQQMAGQCGAFPASYDSFVGGAGPALDDLAGLDGRLGAALTDAAGADRSGRGQSGAVVNGAAADSAALAPFSGTPAGDRLLVSRLRARLAQQHQVVEAFRRRDARLAALLRSMAYCGPMPGGGAPFGGGMPFNPSGLGGGGASGAGLGSMPALSGLPSMSALTPNQVRNRGHITLGEGDENPANLAPLGNLTLDSGRREVAQAIIREAQRRGYSPSQTIAILSTALQESGLSPRAISRNGLWNSIFQQDDSYPDRDNPNIVIESFFNRLAAKGGPHSPDVWQTIFWLQQAPGAIGARSSCLRASGVPVRDKKPGRTGDAALPRINWHTKHADK